MQCYIEKMCLRWRKWLISSLNREILTACLRINMKKENMVFNKAALADDVKIYNQELRNLWRWSIWVYKNKRYRCYSQTLLPKNRVIAYKTISEITKNKTFLLCWKRKVLSVRASCDDVRIKNLHNELKNNTKTSDYTERESMENTMLRKQREIRKLLI